MDNVLALREFLRLHLSILHDITLSSKVMDNEMLNENICSLEIAHVTFVLSVLSFPG